VRAGQGDTADGGGVNPAFGVTGAEIRLTPKIPFFFH